MAHLENTLICLKRKSLLKARQKTERRQHLETMTWRLLGCKQRQITWFIDIQGDTWETADFGSRAACTRRSR